MAELKERITENGIDYILAWDYYIPDLKLPEVKRSFECTWERTKQSVRHSQSPN